jgi:hypothetical protein
MSRLAASIACALVTACTSVMAPSVVAAEVPAAVRSQPIWRVVSYRTKEEKKGVYLNYLTRVYRLKLEAWKAAGLLSDYKILTVDPARPEDPDVIFMFEYPNMAALDVPDAVWSRAAAKALEPLKDDKDVQQWNAEFESWRSLVGYAPLAHEVIGR